MKAVTDSGPIEPGSAKPNAIQNLFTILEVLSTPEVYGYFEEQYNQCTIRYGDLKKQLAEDIIAFCTPIRERILEYASDVTYMYKVAAIGADKARESASRTLKEVRHRIGFRS